MDEDRLQELRERMVSEQIERRGIRDPLVLAAMRRVPRHEFVPDHLRASAYDDRALPIGEGQTISQPYMVAVMTAALELAAGARVLEVGTGSAYQAAILSEIAGEVVSIERRELLARDAAARLSRLGFNRVKIIVGDGTEGYPPRAPYDGILVTAGAPGVPGPLRSQLADGGRLVIPIGTEVHQELVVLRRVSDQFTETRREPCVFVPLIGRYGWA